MCALLKTLLIAVFLVLAAVPAGARAASVRVDGPRLLIEAGPGERNDLTVALGQGAVVVHDAGAALIAGRGCRAQGGSVRCPAPESVVVRLADGDDRADLGGLALPADIDGGAGADRIAAGPAADVLMGGEGPDEILGGDGGDRIDAGPGDDTVRAGGGHDTVAGGPGADMAAGGAGADVIRGAEGADTLRGDGEGSGGRDGRDRLYGEADGDIVDGRGPGPDLVDGGVGANTLLGDDDDTLLPDTRAPEAAILSDRLRIDTRAGRLSLTVGCPAHEHAGCAVRAALEVQSQGGYREVAAGRAVLDGGSRRTLTIAVSRDAARRLAQARMVRIRIRARDAAGNEAVTSRRFRAA